MRKYQDKIVLASLLLLALVCRSFLLFRDLEYDEVWSLVNYAEKPLPQIFSDLLTPNNHPVNSLLIKVLYFSREYFWSIRLGSLAFSLGSVVLLFISGKLFYRRKGAYFAAAAGAVLPPLILAGTTARGYSGQLFFLLLCGVSLIKCRKGSLNWTLTAAGSGLLAIISLPTGILYLTPMGIFFILYLIRKRVFNPVQLTVFLLTALLTGTWYIANWKNFAHTAAFSENINSVTSLGSWLYQLLSYNAVAWFLIPAAIFFRKRRKISWILLTLIFFPVLAALFTPPGPYRIYLPGCAAGILLLVPDFKKQRYQYAATIILLLLQIFLSLPVIPDNRVINNLIAFREANGIVNVYDANTAYPVSWNHPECIETFYRQLAKAGSMPQCILALEKNQLCGVSADGKTCIRELPVPVKTPASGEPYLLPLVKCNELPPETLAFCLIPPMPVNAAAGNIRFLQASEIIYLNSRFTVPLTAPDGSTHRFALIAFKCSGSRHFPKKAPIFVPAVEK